VAFLFVTLIAALILPAAVGARRSRRREEAERVAG
jgi:type II secretory pathway pseudopilin PulG